MIFGTKSVEFSYAHNKQGMDKVERFIENIGDIQKLEIELTEKLHQLKRYHVPEQYMLGLACKVFEFNVQPHTDIKPKRIEELLLMACRENVAVGLMRLLKIFLNIPFRLMLILQSIHYLQNCCKI